MTASARALAAVPDADLLAGLATIDTHPAGRFASAFIIDELARRHPPVAAALTAWAESLDDARSQADVVLATVTLQP